MAVTLIQGKNMLLFARLYKDRTVMPASKIRFQTEHSISMEKESESTITKDGTMVSISDGENEIDMTSLAYNDDEETLFGWRYLRDEGFKNNELVEIWQVDLDSLNDEGMVTADYFQGYFSAFELSAPADGSVELNYTYAINGNGAQGQDTVDMEAIKQTAYDYQRMAVATDTGAEV
ncbi:phage major tail protein, TP901-1 family [Aerococcaceae bacterium DSM 111020]|nr:phage major tail protein, TP901-1 family [Aerococcaceae bacterium DSM 111020]